MSQERKTALRSEGQTVRLEAALGWAELRATARFSDWLPRYAKIRTAFSGKFAFRQAQDR